MKHRLFLILFCWFCTVHAQKEAANWYFGNNAGLNFNSGAPVALTDGQLSTDEGSAVISDASGKLLFYTDGTTVYNREHEVMQNGTGLMGHYSSTNSAIIVPKPSTASGYYIFTIDYQFNANGLQYSEVDMNLDNGLGAVTSKNVLLMTPVTEKLTAIKIPGENAFFVLTHNAHSDEFLTFRVSPAGVDHNPIRSAIGPFITWPDVNSAGQIKISPNGKTLGGATTGMGLELYDFNSVTGEVSNYRQLFTDYSFYGVEFSPNSRYLYTTSTTHGLLQYDLHAGDIADIIESKTVLLEGSYGLWAMQLAIDGKIYIATSTWSPSSGAYLDVINNPNVAGAASGYEAEGVSLGGRSANLGLPPFIQSLFHISGITASNFCHGSPTSFSLSVEMTITNIKWEFGDGTSSTLQNPTHTYSKPGEYEIKVTVVSGTETDTRTETISIYAVPKAEDIDEVKLCIPEAGHPADLTSIRSQILGFAAAEHIGVSYFASEADAIANRAPLGLQYIPAMGKSPVYFRVFQKVNPECHSLGKFDLMVTAAPKLFQVQDWKACDPVGTYTFDLSRKTSEVLGDQDPKLISVNFFASENDAVENRDSINLVKLNTDVVQEVVFRIESKLEPTCYQLGNFMLEVGQGFQEHTPENVATCDTGGGFGSFDTSSWISGILKGQKDFRVTFFNESGSALPHPLPDYYRNSTPYAESILARVENIEDANCISELRFELLVNQLPNLSLPPSLSLCDLEPFFDFEPEGDADTWEWRDPAGKVISKTAAVRLVEAGSYSLKVGRKENGVLCERSYSLQLLRSRLPKITAVELQDWSERNFIEILAFGDGDLEYSIDGVNYTNSNYFPELPGAYIGSL